MVCPIFHISFGKPSRLHGRDLRVVLIKELDDDDTLNGCLC